MELNALTHIRLYFSVKVSLWTLQVKGLKPFLLKTFTKAALAMGRMIFDDPYDDCAEDFLEDEEEEDEEEKE